MVPCGFTGSQYNDENISFITSINLKMWQYRTSYTKTVRIHRHFVNTAPGLFNIANKEDILAYKAEQKKIKVQIIVIKKKKKKK